MEFFYRIFWSFIIDSLEFFSRIFFLEFSFSILFFSTILIHLHPFSQFKYEHESGNIIGQWTFSWILSLLFHGYKTPIDVDILEKVTASETSAEHSDNLKRLLTSETSTLFKSCLKMNSYLISMGAFYRFAADVCSLGSALSIKWIVQAMNNGTQVTHQPFIIPKKTWGPKKQFTEVRHEKADLRDWN